MTSFYKRLSPTWRKRLKVVGIHNYSDVNRNRSTGTAKIIRTARKYNSATKFWFTETGALASFGAARSLQRDAPGVAHPQHVHVRHALPRVRASSASTPTTVRHRERHELRQPLQFDAGLVDPDGTPRPVYRVFKARLSDFSR